MNYEQRNSAALWSLTASGDDTLRFELRDGDFAAIDANKYTPAERTDVIFTDRFAAQDPVHINFNLKVDPGDLNSASFLVLGQFVANMADGTTAASSPFDIDLSGDQLIVYIRWTDVSGKIVGKHIYVDSANIVRDALYNIDVKAIFDSGGQGRLVLAVNGAVVADYSGPLGFAGQDSVSWAEGISRDAKATETMAVEYSNHVFESGDLVQFPEPATYLPAPSLAIKYVNAIPGDSDIFATTLYGYALGRTTVSIYADGVLVGTSTVSPQGRYDIVVNVESAGSHYLTAVLTDSAGNSSISSVPSNFIIGDSSDPAALTPANFILSMGGETYWVQNASRPWSFSSPDANTLRFEVRDNDVFLWDRQAGIFSERSEIRDEHNIKDGTPLEVSYKFNLEPGARNDAAFLVTGQLHQDDYMTGQRFSPPFEVGFSGEKMVLTIRYLSGDGKQAEKIIYSDGNDIVRGRYYDINIKAVFDPTGQIGRLVVTRDGVTLADYSGPLGFPGQDHVYWKEGVYRSSAGAVTIAANFRDLVVTAGHAVTFPDKNDFIAAPTIDSTSIAGDAADRTVTFNGQAKAGTVLIISEGGTPIGETATGPDGTFSLGLTVAAGSRHTIEVLAQEGSRSGVGTLVELTTAADLIARIASFNKQPALSSIVLTDTNILPISAATYLASLINANSAALAKIQDDFTFMRTTLVTGQSYDKLTEQFSESGLLLERIRYSGSKVVYSETISSDGSKVVKAYPPAGGVDISFYGADGKLTEADRINAAGVTYAKEMRLADGSRVSHTYDPRTGAETGYTAIAASGEKQVVTLNIAGQPYSQQVYSYNVAGKMIAQERFTADNIRIYAQVWLNEGSREIHKYSPASGLETDVTYFRPDGTYDIKTLQIVGQAYATKLVSYSSGGKIVGTDTFDGAGKLLTSEDWAADGSYVAFTIDPHGIRIGYTQTFVDGRKAIAVNAAGPGEHLLQRNFYDAVGHLTRTEQFGPDDILISTLTLSADGSSVLIVLNATTKLPSVITAASADGAKVVSTFVADVISTVERFDPAGHAVEIDRYDAAGHLVELKLFSADGSFQLKSLNPSDGSVESVAVHATDGSYTITVFAPGSSTLLLSNSRFDASGHLLERVLYDAEGRTLSVETGANGTADARVTAIDPATGLATGYSETHADGSRTVVAYVTNSVEQVARIDLLDPTGKLLTTTLFDAAGHQVQTTEYDDEGGHQLSILDPDTGLRVASTYFSEDGSQVESTYQDGSIHYIRVFNASQVLIRTDLYGPQNQKLWSDVAIEGGHRLSIYGPSGYVQTATATFVDGSKEITEYFNSASATAASIELYDPASKLILKTTFDVLGHKVMSKSFGMDGSVLSTQYDPATGEATGYVRTDASGAYVAGIYDSRFPKGLRAFDSYDASGKHLTAKTWNADGSISVYVINISGMKTGVTTTKLDGSYSVSQFLAGSEVLLASSFTYGADKQLKETNTFNNLGQLIKTEIRQPDGSRENHTFDAATGHETGYTIRYLDKSQVIANLAVVGKGYTEQYATYDGAGKLVSMIRTYGDDNHTVALNTQVRGDGSSETHNYDTAGREISKILTYSDSSQDTLVFTYIGTSTVADTTQQIHSGVGGVKQWSDIGKADGTHLQTALAGGVSLTSHTDVPDTMYVHKTASDTFVFPSHFGNDTIIGFKAGAASNHDIVEIQSPAGLSYEQLSALATKSGGDTLLSISPNDTILFKGVTPDKLVEANFHFTIHADLYV